MARQQLTSIENNFSKGLVTEATGLNFPENSCVETWNCIFDETGKVRRRKGFALETGATTATLDTASVSISEFLWTAVAGSGSVTFVVLQIGATLYFYRNDETDILTDGKETFTVSLNTFKVAAAPSVSTVECDFTAGNGSLFVVHPYCEPFYVEYNQTADTISTVQIEVLVRDLEGVDDGLDNETRPNSLSAAHEYNLDNQGWYFGTVTGTSGVEIKQRFKNTIGVYPSNSDIWWYGKKASNDVWKHDQMLAEPPTDTPAPKGHYKFSAFDIDRASIVSGVESTDSSYFRPKTAAFYAGRCWYSGVDAQGYNNKVYFSQVMLSNDDAGKCYQLNDPSAENLFDLLDTDGGEVSIPEAGTIIKLFATQNSILVFASNGVWSLAGSEGVGFIATDYAVSKLSSIGANNVHSFVDVDGYPVWWNLDGIYTVTPSEAGISLQVQSLSENSIQTFFDAIPGSSKEYVKGVYNSLDRRIIWTYRSTAESGIADRFQYDRALILNTKSGAFYPWSFANDGNALIQGIIAVPQSSGRVFKFLYFQDDTNALGWAEADSTTYTDWGEATGTYESYFTTGYRIRGDALRESTVDYLTVYTTTTTDSACKVQPVWDYANSGGSGRYGSKQEVYLSRGNRDLQIRKLLIRGQGRSLQFKFSSDLADKPFEIQGWSAFESVTQLP